MCDARWVLRVAFEVLREWLEGVGEKDCVSQPSLGLDGDNLKVALRDGVWVRFVG